MLRMRLKNPPPYILMFDDNDLCEIKLNRSLKSLEFILQGPGVSQAKVTAIQPVRTTEVDRLTDIYIPTVSLLEWLKKSEIWENVQAFPQVSSS